MIGSRLGPYEITEEVGSGGMATVYRAYQASMDRHVAVKVIRASILGDGTLRERFQREAKLIAKLEHPHLLPVYDFDGSHEPPYIVMRFLEGGTLKQVLAGHTLPPDEILYMLRQVASALDYAHRQGIVHRDLKPSNIMIDREGNAFIADFGIARVEDPARDLTATGMLVGTPGYMAPEQAKGSGKVDHRADIYALGAMVFEMLTGHPPYEHESNLGILMAHVQEPVPSAVSRNPELPAEVDPILGTALAKKPEERYGSAGEFVTALAAALKVQAAHAPARLQAATQVISVAQLQAFAAETAGTGPETPSDQQRQMTAVYVDITELAEFLYERGEETESARQTMEKLWNRFGALVTERGGLIQSRTDDVGVALWGLERTSEDDPEQAVRAALRMRDAVENEMKRLEGKETQAGEEMPLPFAAGVTTGPVLLERETATGTLSASGPTITLAGRLREAAPPGTILVAHDTFTQVRGVFSFQEHVPIRIRGRKEPLEVYLALRARPRAFRLQARGIEGVETKMIGREIELRLLQEALTLTVEDGETQVVTVVGEAGVGKSRLLFEFTNWIDLMEETLWFFQARATQPSMLQPYSLTRDLFSFRFQILDSDPLELVHEKFVKGVESFLGEGTEEKAHMIGQLVGFDFSTFPSVAAALSDPENFRKQAQMYLGELFVTASRTHPVFIQIEDIHWADDRSLDLLNNLVRENTQLPLFVICMARPSLYERRPQWGEGQRFHARVQLEPLSMLSSRRLVKELLKKAKSVPTELRDLVIDRADGNPFYIEELIKALIDDGVIVKGEEEWAIDTTRLSAVRIPPTLTGVLQARLDTLPTHLQQLLQRASVVGRVFWDSAAVFLSQKDGVTPAGVGGMLEELRQREMIFLREESGFAGMGEYVFRHAILRDVTYGTVVPRQRRAYHKLVGDWLLQIGGERAHEHALLVAEHYDLAGEPALAAAEFARAGRRAIELSAIEEAIATLERARKLLEGKEAHAEQLLPVLVQLGEAYGFKGAFRESHDILNETLTTARAKGNRLVQTQALAQLARLGIWEGEPDAALRHLNEALPLARELGEKSTLVFVLRQMGNLLVGDQPGEAREYLTESLALARELEEKEATASALNSLGNAASSEEDFPTALERYKEALALFREFKHKAGVSMALMNMGHVQMRLGDQETALRWAEESLTAGRETGSDSLIEGALEVKCEVLLRMGRDEPARAVLEEAIRSGRAGNHRFTLLLALGFDALLRARRGDPTDGLERISLVMEKIPDAGYAKGIRWIQEEIAGMLSSEEAAKAVERGKERDLDALLDELSGGRPASTPASPAGN